MRYDPERVEAVIMQLRQYVDPVAFMSQIAKRTKYGRRPGPTAWHYTREMLAARGHAEDAEKIAEAFGLVGIEHEVDAGVWVAEHLDTIE